MHKFIKNVFVFIVIIVLADVVFGHVMKYCMTHAKGGNTKSQYFGFCEVEADILLFGSSRCVHHYDPQIISDSLAMSCYNAGRGAMGIIYHYAKLTADIERYMPKMVIYDVVLSYDFRCESNYDKYIRAFRPYYGYGKTADIALDIDGSERYKNLLSFYRFNYIFIEMVADNILLLGEVMENGFKPIDKQMELEFPVGQDKALEEVDSIKLKYFEKLIAHCQEKGIKLVFAASPRYKRKNSIAYEPIRRLCAFHNIPFMDYYADSTFVQKKDFFCDEAHMNRKGTEAFSRKFAHDLKIMTQE